MPSTNRTRSWTFAVAVLALPIVLDAARALSADDIVCAATASDRVRTAPEIANTVAACSRIIDTTSASREARARAYFVRGLNQFLDAVNLALTEMKPVDQASGAAQARVKSALDDLTASIAAAPQPSALPFSLRATIHTTFWRYDEALADLGEAIKANPNDSVPHVQRALIYERQDRFAEARADLDAALSLDPANQNARINRAALWTRYGDLDRAFADYDQAVMLGGVQTWSALSGRGKLAARLGDPQRAYADWTRAADMSPLPSLGAQLHVRAGTVARDYLKDPDKAMAAYGRAMAATPASAEPYIQRGIAYERVARTQEAGDDYRKALDLARRNPLEAASADYVRFRLDVLHARQSRRAGDPRLPPNINVLSGEPPRDRSRRIALVIGNATYLHVTPLDNTDRDAESVGGALAGAGFAKVTIATNLERDQLVSVLRQFASETAAADWAMIYYAGHGIEVDGRNYLIPTDASLEALRNPTSGTVALDEILATVGSAKALRLIALDACRDNPFVQEAHLVAARQDGDGRNAPPQQSGPTLAPSLAPPGKDIGGGFAGLMPAELNTLVLYSTQPGHVALDGNELNSPFTRAFIRNLPVPGQDLAAFFTRLDNDVMAATERRQRPAVNGQLRQGDQFYFFPP